MHVFKSNQTYSSLLLHGIPYYSFPPHWGPATVIFPFSQAPKTPSVLVSYGYITYHHKFGNIKQYHSLPYSSIGHKSKQDQLGSLFRFPWGQNQHVGQAELLFAGSGFECASSLIQDVLAVIDLRSLFPCWLSTRCFSAPESRLCVLSPGPLQLQTSKRADPPHIPKSL